MAYADSAVQRPIRRAVSSGPKVLGYCLAIISVAAAVIHFAVAGEHFQEYWLFGVFMLVVAWLQLTWAVAMVARPAKWQLWAGAIVNAGIVVIYILTRTVGDMVGPTPHDVEPFGFGDGLCTVLEAIIVAGCCFLLFEPEGFPAAARAPARRAGGHRRRGRRAAEHRAGRRRPGDGDERLVRRSGGARRRDRRMAVRRGHADVRRHRGQRRLGQPGDLDARREHQRCRPRTCR